MLVALTITEWWLLNLGVMLAIPIVIFFCMMIFGLILTASDAIGRRLRNRAGS